MAHKQCLTKITNCDCVNDDIEELKSLKKELKNCIRVWEFASAPKKYQQFSQNGEDEDWLALVPKKLSKDYIGWLESENFGCCSIRIYELKSGARIYIGSHA